MGASTHPVSESYPSTRLPLISGLGGHLYEREIGASVTGARRTEASSERGREVRVRGGGSALIAGTARTPG
jgi:hypothetical protein